MTAPVPWEIYRRSERPASGGRLLLADALEYVATDLFGLDGQDIVSAFERPGDADDRLAIASLVRWLGALLVDGVLEGWIRPFGGGEPERMPASSWELDDYVARFATSAVCPERWSDPGARPTHWIFLDERVFSAWWEEWAAGREPVDGYPIAGGSAEPEIPPAQAPASVLATAPGRLLKRTQVLEMTGWSKNTLYRRIAAAGFPRPVAMGESMSRWRLEEIEAWLTDRRRH
ncbi:AlpA family phage regulatory protein [Sphingomonas parva]|uniref:AlpA family phage regulatory protein n=1 Tax=Sphingomonas parva TaxID=2555898 RepID=A0A4Y8ZYT0_9SPHN|nr:AlpA family phage regulatory protein [Sphingomonas parva]TFI59816.1 AlpA family phage regulatory protein [Sphingomonas parva]